MKTTITAIMLILALALVAQAGNVTFSQTSSAKTSTPNVRIGYMVGPLQTAVTGGPGAAMQAGVIDTIGNYYLTKTLTIPFGKITWALIETDQDTKMYIGSDLTNYLTIYAGTPFEYIPRH